MRKNGANVILGQGVRAKVDLQAGKFVLMYRGDLLKGPDEIEARRKLLDEKQIPKNRAGYILEFCAANGQLMA